MKVEQPFFVGLSVSCFSTLLLYHCNDKHWLLLRRNFCIAMLKVFLFCDKVSLYCHTVEMIRRLHANVMVYRSLKK